MSLDLNMTILEYCETVAYNRRSQKKDYPKKIVFEKSVGDKHELAGIIGELVYGFETAQIPDFRQYETGDDGFDFRGRVQVKSSHNPRAKYLIEFKDTDFTQFDTYVFVAVDLTKNTGEIVGWISVKDFQEQVEVKDFGFGDRLALKLDRLKKFKKTV